MKQTYTFASASVSLILIVCQWPQSLSEAVVLLLVAPTSSTFSHSHTTLLLVHSVSPISLYSTHRLEMPPIASCRFAAPWPHLLERKSDHCCFFSRCWGSFGVVGFVCFGVLVNEFWKSLKLLLHWFWNHWFVLDRVLVFFFFWFIYLLNLKYIPHNLMQCMSLCLSAWLINKMLTKWNGYIYIYIYRHSCVRERERENTQ